MSFPSITVGSSNFVQFQPNFCDVIAKNLCDWPNITLSIFIADEITLQFCLGWSMTILPKSDFVHDKCRRLCRFVTKRYKFLGEKGIPKATTTSSFVCKLQGWVIIVVLLLNNLFQSKAPYFDSAAVISELSQETSQHLIVTRN